MRVPGESFLSGAYTIIDTPTIPLAEKSRRMNCNCISRAHSRKQAESMGNAVNTILGSRVPLAFFAKGSESTYPATIPTPAAAAALRRSASVVAKGKLRRIASAKYAAS